VGLVKPEGIDMALTFGGNVGYWVGPRVIVGGEVDYYNKTMKEVVLSTTIETQLSDLAISAVGKYDVLSGAAVGLRVGGGLGLHLVRASASTRISVPPYMDTTWTVESSSEEFGFHFIGEITKPLSPALSLLGQVKYTIVEDYNAMRLTVGLLYASSKGGARED
jgi:hypothetical protein